MWKTILDEVSKSIVLQMAQVVIPVILLIILLFAGLFFSYFIKVSVIKALRVLRFEEFFSAFMPRKTLEKAGIRYSLTEIIGILSYWIGLLVSFSIILNAMGLTIVSDLVNKIILYIPNVIVAIFILLLGMLGASFLRNTVTAVARNAGIAKANIVGKISEIITIIFASVMALEQLKLDVRILETAIGITLGSIGLAGAIAFGLGCKDIVGKFIIGIIDKISNPE